MKTTDTQSRDAGHGRWLWRLVGPLRIVAHSQVQLDVFLRNHGIPKDKVRRVMSVRDVEGIRPDSPLVLLPGWQECREADEIFSVWHHRGGSVLRISEPRVLGQQPLCENDTDGDGDCELCARKGGCRWPNEQGEPRSPSHRTVPGVPHTTENP